MIAYMLTSRVDTKTGVKVEWGGLSLTWRCLPQIGIIEKDPSYRYSLSTSSPLGIRMQSCLPETIESSLFGTDFLRCNLGSHSKVFNFWFRNLQHEMSVSADTESEQEYLNQPNIKFFMSLLNKKWDGPYATLEFKTHLWTKTVRPLKRSRNDNLVNTKTTKHPHELSKWLK